MGGKIDKDYCTKEYRLQNHALALRRRLTVADGCFFVLSILPGDILSVIFLIYIFNLTGGAPADNG